ETLRIPWGQDFRMDGGNALFAYRGTSGPAIHIDSQMNCRYKLGLITSNSPDPVVLIRPENPGPDDFVVNTASVFDFSAIVSGHLEGTSLALDTSYGPIVNSTFFAEETNSMKRGLYVTDAGGTGYSFSNNTVRIPYGNQYHALKNCVGLQLGDPGSTKILHNVVEGSYHAPRGAHFDEKQKRYITLENYVGEEAIGALIHAQRNVLTLSFFGPRQPGYDVVFETGSRDNTVFVMTLPNGITHRSEAPTNRIVPNWPVGFDVETPSDPASGEWTINRTAMTAQIMIVQPGVVTSYTKVDAGGSPQGHPHNLSLVDTLHGPERPAPTPHPRMEQTFEGGLATGQSFMLEPGDGIQLTYATAPSWRWKALR
ncbi:MAG: hypothetical protein FJY97_02710, partial [candidate division Zixibacteria bacterium]|nr:hypothetical protein [candidate division Zixibacteria bacterium]